MRSLARLLPYHRRYWRPFWLGIGGLLAARVFEALIPLFLRQGIDAIAAGSAALAVPALGIAACVAARLVSISTGRRAVRNVGVAVSYDLRKRLYDHLQRQGPGFFARYSTGDLMARAINDVQLVRQAVGQGTRTVLVLGFSAAVGLAFMLSLAPGLALMLLPPLPLIGAVAYVLARRIYAQSMRLQEGFSTLSERVQENLNGIRTIQAQAQEEWEIRRFTAVNQSYNDRYLALLRTNSLLASWMPSLGALCTLVILGIGGGRVMAGELSVGTFAAFFWYLGMVLGPVREAGNVVNLFQRASAAATRLWEVLDHAPEIEDRPRPDAPPKLRGEIEIDALTYRHPGASEPALRDVSLRIAPGQTAALIGRVGAGKSTLLRILVRLLDPPRGAVRLDGVDLRALPLARAREQVALVPQDAFLFAESLRENISYDDPARPPGEIWDAAGAAQLRATLEELPDGLDTVVGERGVTLSGGQKQRATLARGLIRNAPVLLLDDCFSSVDAETEEAILERLIEERGARTTVLVSQRVSTVRHADHIYVLEAGRVIESGTHEELVAGGGCYADLEAAQRRRGRLARAIAADDAREAAL